MEKWDEASANMVLALTTSSKTLEEVTFRERRPQDWQEENEFCKLWQGIISFDQTCFSELMELPPIVNFSTKAIQTKLKLVIPKVFEDLGN